MLWYQARRQSTDVLGNKKTEVGPYRVIGTGKKGIFVYWKGSEKHFNLCQVIPVLGAQGDRKIKRVLDGV